VDVIANERIKWVAATRTDFQQLIGSLDHLRHKIVVDKAEISDLQEAVAVANKLTSLIGLKINADDVEDRKLLRVSNWLSYFASKGTDEEYGFTRAYLSLLVNFSLKDEWEKAKQEAAGPLRWVWLKAKQQWRVRKRPALIASSIPMSILEKTDNKPAGEEIHVVLDAPRHKQEDK